LTATKSKGVRERNKERTKEIVRLRDDKKLTYGQISLLLKVDRSNVYKAYMNAAKTKETFRENQ